MYERFTDRARKVMQLACREAQRLNHEYIDTEHILLGLVKQDAGVAVNVLKNLDIDLRKLRLEVEKLVLSGPETVTPGKLPQTPRTKRVIEYSLEEARKLNHNYVGTEHVLLGLFREQEGVAAQVLLNLGLRLADVREEVLNIVGVNTEVRDRVGERVVSLLVGHDLYTAFTHLPQDVVQSLKGIDDCLKKLTQEKETALAEQDFDKAARLRDKADKITRKLRDALKNLQTLDREAENDSR